MKKKTCLAALLFLLFAGFTLMVVCYDVQPIGPEGAMVGFAGLNQRVFEGVGTHPVWYDITEWGGLGLLLIPLGFGVAGLCQWVRRRSIRKVDPSLLALGLMYLLVLLCYLFFEEVVVNCRPVLVEGTLEASYPSSHTLLSVCILGTSSVWIHAHRKGLHLGVDGTMFLLGAAMVVGRLLSGVHWFTDIVGGLLLAAALVALYGAMIDSTSAR